MVMSLNTQNIDKWENVISGNHLLGEAYTRKLEMLWNRQQVDHKILEIEDLGSTIHSINNSRGVIRNTMKSYFGRNNTCMLTTPLKKFLKVCPPETSGLQKRIVLQKTT